MKSSSDSSNHLKKDSIKSPINWKSFGPTFLELACYVRQKYCLSNIASQFVFWRTLLNCNSLEPLQLPSMSINMPSGHPFNGFHSFHTLQSPHTSSKNQNFQVIFLLMPIFPHEGEILLDSTLTQTFSLLNLVSNPLKDSFRGRD